MADFILRLAIAMTGCAFLSVSAHAQSDVEVESIDSSACVECHATSLHETEFEVDLQHSVHDGLECLDCHIDRGTVPHYEVGECAQCDACSNCHDDEAATYTIHGRGEVGSSPDTPHCHECHGDHDILPSAVKRSMTHPINLPQTCGTCHENLDLTTKYEILIDHPIEIYQTSVHGQATRGGIYVAASCNDCHSTNGTAHRILAPGFQDSSINHFNIPFTCGKCHKGIESDFWEGIHGRLVARGETDAPVCTDCHGEHGILSPDDPRSPVSRSRVAEMTCSPCHESAVLNAKYGLKTKRLTTFIDSYHGLKSRAGDTHVANCASCHGVHRILPSSDPTSTVHPSNLQHTCGECHPNISEKMASTPIHGVSGVGLRTRAAEFVEDVYIVAIVVIIGLMVLHWLIDLQRHLRDVIGRRPQIQRMRPDEVVQHALLALSFISLVISGFALRYDQGFVSRFFFGWEGGFEVRGTLHRIWAVVFVLTIVWHAVYLTTARGRKFLADMMPIRRDFEFFIRRMLHNLGLGSPMESVQRFNYIEKAEYWALMWGTVVMICTGFLLWFDNWFIQFLPKGVLDVALVIHFWEAWLASLAVLVWHLYAVIFHPHVYPMNPSWITGHIPDDMYELEHPGHLEEARRDTEDALRRQLERVRRREAAEHELKDEALNGDSSIDDQP